MTTPEPVVVVVDETITVASDVLDHVKISTDVGEQVVVTAQEVELI